MAWSINVRGLRDPVLARVKENLADLMAFHIHPESRSQLERAASVLVPEILLQSEDALIEVIAEGEFVSALDPINPDRASNKSRLHLLVNRLTGFLLK